MSPNPRATRNAALLFGVVALLFSARAYAEAPRFGLWPLDGNGALALVRHDVVVQIEHPVATTVITQEFDNPTAVSLEAHYYYPVPVGAAVAGLALWVNGERREARVLERQRAREIYEGIVAQKRDPALVERLSGNLFRIRIFPVLPRRRTRVELRFVQVVDQDAPGRYRYTLARPPGPLLDVLRVGATLRAPFSIAEASVRGIAASATLLRRHGANSLGMPLGAEQHVFDRPIELTYRAVALPRTASVLAHPHEGKRLFVAELLLGERARTRPRRVLILVDRSRSVRRHLPLARRLAAAISGQLAGRDRVAVVPFDLLPGPIELLAPREQQARIEQSELGTAFIPAFEAALAASPTQIICITDGGDRYHQAELEQLARMLYDRTTGTVSAVALPGVTDEEPLRDLTRVTGGLYRRIGEGEAQELTALAARLISAPARARAYLLPGEQRLHILRAEADRLVVAGAVPEQAAGSALRLRVADASAEQTVELPSRAVPHRAVEALWASASVDALMARIKLFGEETAIVDQIVTLSKAHGLASEYTALLVTETDADYDRPTSGQRWQRRTAQAGDELPTPSFHSTPEPHEYLLVAIALLLLLHARRRGWLPG